jgi:two-component system CAI-1 autoinducer sensor kinase/phosphatase CqsS
MNVIKYLQDSFKKGTRISRFNLICASVIGASGHFLLYFVYKYLLYNDWENLPIRLIGVAICTGALLKLKNPNFLGKYFDFYWHTMLIYLLPFIITLFMLKNNMKEPWLNWEIFMIFVLMSFVPNFIIFVLDLFIGIFAACIVFLFLPPYIALDFKFNIPHYLIVLAFSVFAGFLFSLSNRKGIVAQENNAVLQILASSIAHEMRNPLAQVKFSFNRILQVLPVENSIKNVEKISSNNLDLIYLSIAQGEMAVARGVQIIDMILNETKNKSIDKASFTYCSCFSVTKKALDEYGYESADERDKLSLEYDEDFIINVNETLYIFVLFNLIINAFYFIKPYPDAKILIRLKKGSQYNKIYVKDTGPGIPEENRERLFAPYYSSGKKGGTGLGLAYCKRVMQAFGGDIICDSELGNYTEFILTFPIVNDLELDVFKEKNINKHFTAFRNKRILVVDDEPSDRDQVKKYLHCFQTIVDEADNGREAIDLVMRNRYDAVLMNLNMPVMNGYEAAEAILSGKAGLFASDVPIIGFSKSPSYVARAKTEKIGMRGFISKPVQEFELLNGLSVVLNNKDFNGNSSLSGLTIMIVDDVKVIRLSLRWILEKQNIKVIEAVNGIEAIEHLKNKIESYDLVLMDIQMPGMNGYEATQIIRNTPDLGYTTIPIIGISGESDENDIAKFIEAGMNDYMQKPFDNRILLNKIRKLTKKMVINN